MVGRDVWLVAVALRLFAPCEREARHRQSALTDARVTSPQGLAPRFKASAQVQALPRRGRDKTERMALACRVVAKGLVSQCTSCIALRAIAVQAVLT